MFDDDEMPALYKHISAHLPRKNKRRSLIASADGVPASNIAQHKANFSEYLSGVMCAVHSSFEALVEKQRQDVSSGLSSRIAKLRPKTLGESG
eukprot:5282187-Karenia_brevis.AAC.1